MKRAIKRQELALPAVVLVYYHYWPVAYDAMPMSIITNELLDDYVIISEISKLEKNNLIQLLQFCLIFSAVTRQSKFFFHFFQVAARHCPPLSNRPSYCCLLHW